MDFHNRQRVGHYEELKPKDRYTQFFYLPSFREIDGITKEQIESSDKLRNELRRRINSDTQAIYQLYHNIQHFCETKKLSPKERKDIYIKKDYLNNIPEPVDKMYDEWYLGLSRQQNDDYNELLEKFNELNEEAADMYVQLNDFKEKFDKK